MEVTEVTGPEESTQSAETAIIPSGAPEAPHVAPESAEEHSLPELRLAAAGARNSAVAALDAIVAALPETQGVREIGALRSDIDHARRLLAAGL